MYSNWAKFDFIVFIVVTCLLGAYWKYAGCERADLLANFATEVASIWITARLVDWWVRRTQEIKEQKRWQDVKGFVYARLLGDIDRFLNAVRPIKWTDGDWHYDFVSVWQHSHFDYENEDWFSFQMAVEKDIEKLPLIDQIVKDSAKEWVTNTKESITRVRSLVEESLMNSVHLMEPDLLAKVLLFVHDARAIESYSFCWEEICQNPSKIAILLSNLVGNSAETGKAIVAKSTMKLSGQEFLKRLDEQIQR